MYIYIYIYINTFIYIIYIIKVIERLFCYVLQDAVAQTLSHAQAAIVQGRDIAKHVLLFSETFEDSVARGELLATFSGLLKRV